MTYGVRTYGTREYGDGMRVITTAVGGGPPPGDAIAGTDTLTFSETGTLSTSLRATDTLTFTETGNLKGGAFLVADMAHPQAKVRFTEYAQLSVIVPPVAPPDGTVYVRRVSHTMPAPNLDANGRPQ